MWLENMLFIKVILYDPGDILRLAALLDVSNVSILVHPLPLFTDMVAGRYFSWYPNAAL